MKAIDSNLLVYASLENHPAMTACEQYIAGYPEWLTSIVNLVELRRVLVAVYGVSESDADAKFNDLRKALVVEDLTVAVAAATLSHRQSYGIDFNDAVLLESSRQRGVTSRGSPVTASVADRAAPGGADADRRRRRERWRNEQAELCHIYQG